MKSTEFTYWLQGFFEIGTCNCSLNTHELNETQVESISKHLEMVFKYEKKPSRFCSWLEGFLVGKETLSEEHTSALKTRLSEEFEHVIDPSYGDKKMQDLLSEIHPKKPFGPDTKIRC